MSENRSKILGTVVFVLLISSLIYLIFFSSGKIKKREIEMVQVTGNNLLNETEYLNFTMLKSIPEKEEITLPVIKDRFEKHPYVKKAEVEIPGGNKAKVLVTEKRIMAMVLIEPDAYYLTEEFQVLPVFMNTKFVDVPVISNPGISKELRPLNFVKSENLKEAFKIIESLRMTNQNLSAGLAEINLRNGGDIILTFSNINAPVIFGRDGAASKMVYLEMLWDKMINGKSLVENSEYVDLRFANEIFIGSAETTGLL